MRGLIRISLDNVQAKENPPKPMNINSCKKRSLDYANLFKVGVKPTLKRFEEIINILYNERKIFSEKSKKCPDKLEKRCNKSWKLYEL